MGTTPVFQCVMLTSGTEVLNVARAVAASSEREAGITGAIRTIGLTVSI